MRTGYVMDDFDQLFERAGNNVHTINIRVFWSDMIITRDHRVVQHVLANGFSEFEKGKKLGLMYASHPYFLNRNITIMRFHFQGFLACLATGYSTVMGPSGGHTVD